MAPVLFGWKLEESPASKGYVSLTDPVLVLYYDCGTSSLLIRQLRTCTAQTILAEWTGCCLKRMKWGKSLFSSQDTDDVCLPCGYSDSKHEVNTMMHHSLHRSLTKLTKCFSSAFMNLTIFLKSESSK